MRAFKIIVREARPGVKDKLFVNDREGKPIAVGVLQTNEHLVLRFAKDQAKLVDEDGWDFEIVFDRHGGQEELHGFKYMIEQMSFGEETQSGKSLEHKPPRPKDKDLGKIRDDLDG
tara:strand:+ start:811 stop:1158 length:348 start_codon:yes stop_codon:yes gene_type:complete